MTQVGFEQERVIPEGRSYQVHAANSGQAVHNATIAARVDAWEPGQALYVGQEEAGVWEVVFEVEPAKPEPEVDDIIKFARELDDLSRKYAVPVYVTSQGSKGPGVSRLSTFDRLVGIEVHVE